MNLTSIPALRDNYIWLLNNDAGQCLIVDPGEARPVIDLLNKRQWQPTMVLLTHHHHDHVDGVGKLRDLYPALRVYGPQETQHCGVTHIVNNDDIISFSGHKFRAISTAGHTLGHVSYFSFPYLFCGDTLFSGGCGRLFEGSAAQMYASLQKISALPDETLVCSAHEYTLDNMIFSRTLLPDDTAIYRYYCKIKELRAKNLSSLPVKLGSERKINLFLRTQETKIKELFFKDQQTVASWQVFAALRAKKDLF